MTTAHSWSNPREVVRRITLDEGLDSAVASRAHEAGTTYDAILEDILRTFISRNGDGGNSSNGTEVHPSPPPAAR